MFAEHGGDTVVIEIQRIPNPAAVIGLGLDQHRQRGQHFHLLIHVFQKVPRVERHPQPGGFERLDHAHDTPRGPAQAPVILQTHRHATALGRFEALPQAVDHPLEAALVVIALERRFDALVFHQLVEILAGAPGAGVHPHGGDAHGIGQFNAPDGVVDVLLAHLLVRRQKSLMGGEAAQVQAEQESPALEPLEVVVAFLLHLAVQDLHAVKAHFSSQVDTGLDAAQLLVAELPVRVSGDSDAVGARRRLLALCLCGAGGLRGGGEMLGTAGCQGQRGGRRGQKLTAIGRHEGVLQDQSGLVCTILCIRISPAAAPHPSAP